MTHCSHKWISNLVFAKILGIITGRVAFLKNAAGFLERLILMRSIIREASPVLGINGRRSLYFDEESPIFLGRITPMRPHFCCSSPLKFAVQKAELPGQE